jgi:hypothetical protein
MTMLHLLFIGKIILFILKKLGLAYEEANSFDYFVLFVLPYES